VVEEMHQRVLERMGKALGRDHRATLKCMNNLRTALQAQGKYKAAEIYRRMRIPAH
jgi:hypothetical protein